MANYLVIKINNTTSESRDGRVSDLPGSAKENSKGHGYGLKIIDRIVSKYDGNLDMKIEAGEFITKVALKVNRQNADEADMIEV